MDREQARVHLTGPISSIATPFNEDSSVDYDGLRNQIDVVLAAGSKTVLLTAGDSHYICLSEAEIAEVTRVAAEHTAGRGMVVAADRYYDTKHSIEFAEYSKQVGADLLMVLPCNWAHSCTADTIVEHYLAVAEHIPVMIVTGLFSPMGPTFALEAIEKTLDRSERVVAIKDDMIGDFARRLCLMAHERVPVFAGGQKVNHMNMWPYGCDGYMSTFISFGLDVPRQYWQAIEAMDLATARGIIRDLDMAFFDFIGTLTGGWNAGFHGSMELFGVTKRWRRKPYYSLNDKEMETLAGFFKEKGLLA
ncbi:MAG: dihydrodipicolinate synthase family protein [Candidatus Latescibacteria bacterium]|jgi:dihydrodipicolinate synthase/N-acetylneuraminate lyase|nr:dihydrodipicolinate synthase family protein [Candidatus Latescibacterota bacterium]